jgi:hypothetical protein
VGLAFVGCTSSKDPGVCFSDPYPIHLAPSNHRTGNVFFSGTAKSILDCTAGTSAEYTAQGKLKMTAQQSGRPPQ